MRLAFLLVISVFVSNGFAAEKLDGYLVDTTFQYKMGERSGRAQSKIIFAKDNTTWNNLVKPSKDVALLGRMVKGDKQQIHMEYIVVDTSRANAIVSTPAIITELGETAEVMVGTSDAPEKIAIKLVATPTKYETKD